MGITSTLRLPSLAATTTKLACKAPARQVPESSVWHSGITCMGPKSEPSTCTSPRIPTWARQCGPSLAPKAASGRWRQWTTTWAASRFSTPWVAAVAVGLNEDIMLSPHLVLLWGRPGGLETHQRCVEEVAEEWGLRAPFLNWAIGACNEQIRSKRQEPTMRKEKKKVHLLFLFVA